MQLVDIIEFILSNSPSKREYLICQNNLPTRQTTLEHELGYKLSRIYRLKKEENDQVVSIMWHIFQPNIIPTLCCSSIKTTASRIAI